jgi:oligoribonuclease NrnB/cAMP/cGMP phosphodiesterase (DHH superfamily)
MQPTHRPLVLFHAGCADGAGAACAAYLKLGENARYLPVQYGSDPPWAELDVPGDVYILDFSYPRDVLLKMAAKLTGLGTIHVLDHHKTAQEALAGIGGESRDAGVARILATFDMNHSGAWLAWVHFHYPKPVPQVLQYLEDRDLWKWELPFSKEFSAGLHQSGVLGDFKKLLPMLDPEFSISRTAINGSIVLGIESEQVRAIAQRAHQQTLCDKEILCVNSPVLRSEIGNALAEKSPSGIAAVYFYDGPQNQYEVSLRSVKDVDTSFIARYYGGGGHKNASGFVRAELPWVTEEHRCCRCSAPGDFNICDNGR